MLDAINTTQSSRIDGVEQFVQAIMVLEGMDPGDLGQFLTDVKEMGAFRMPTGGKASYLTLDMDQTSTQTLVDGMYNAVLKICGMPNPHAGYNTQDTGAAVILRDGWSATEAVASRTETWFKRSERAFLDMAIDFCDIVGGLHLEHRDVGIMFPRRNYTNDSANVDNLVKLLSLDWISPEQAFEHSNMFPDPHSEFLRAKAWHDEQETRDVTSLADVNAGREEYASSWKETDYGGEEQQAENEDRDKLERRRARLRLHLMRRRHDEQLQTVAQAASRDVIRRAAHLIASERVRGGCRAVAHILVDELRAEMIL